MRRIGTLVVLVALLMAGCTQQGKQQALLEGFYDDYLALSCPPQGEYPDWTKIQQLVQRHLTPELFSDWEMSHNAELEEWIDYDMFIQGQDCWPGIRVERINHIAKTQWYEVVVMQPASDNPDKVLSRKHVFYHLTMGDDGQWLIDCIDDGCNRLGNAPTEEDAELRNNTDYQEIINNINNLNRSI